MGASEHRAVPTALGVPLKHLSLITLTFQNSALILIMHYSRIMPQIGDHRYFTSTAVFLNEVIKFAISLTFSLYDISRTLPPSTPATVMLEQLYNSLFSFDGLRLAVPAVLYTLQNSLQYIAVSNLDAVHFQILYQLKILTTAIFSVAILRRSLSKQRWLALVLLTIGVAIVQLPASESDIYDALRDPQSKEFYFPRSKHEAGQLAGGVAEAAYELTKRGLSTMQHSVVKRSATYEGIEEDLGLSKPKMIQSIGVTAVLCAALISGLSGIYFEKVLKESTSNASVWTRNVQLSFYSLFPSLFVGVIFWDGAEITQRGFFDGYNSVVWTAIVFQSTGGILVAMTIAFADNIAKNFATSISIIISCLFSIRFFDFKVTPTFFVGTLFVVISTYLYSSTDITRVSRPPPIRIVSYEKTTIYDGDKSYTPRYEKDREHLMPNDPLVVVKNEARTTSRPSSPMRHHSRVGSSRGKAKRED